MEHKNKETISDIIARQQSTSIDSPTPTPTTQPPPVLDSPNGSPISSLQTSLSHGSEEHEHEHEQIQSSAPPVVNRYVRDEPMVINKTDPGVVHKKVEEGEAGGDVRVRPSLSIMRRKEREMWVKRAALGFRVFGMLFCLVSFSVMAADRNKGWALDSFHRYKEFRYSISVNVIGFAYSGIEGLDMAYHLATGKYVIHHHLRQYFVFSIDQALTYLLISGSSSAAVRVDDWQSNWGKDKFPEMAMASVVMSFMAFVAFAFSSLFSGYSLFTFRSL